MEVVCEGSNERNVISDDDFTTIMGIKNGSGAVLKNSQVSLELLEKFGRMNGVSDKDLYPKKIKDVLKHSKDKDEIKQAFALAAMFYIVCPTARGKFGNTMLVYVQDVTKLAEQPWVTLAMSALKSGIATYKEGKENEKSIGGCVLFLQLYCLCKKGLTVAEIDENTNKNFYIKWMHAYARSNPMEENTKKQLVDNTCRGLKTLSKHLKDKSGTIDKEDTLLTYCPSQLDHVMVVVSYGKRKGQDVWICRNSWGSGWGEDGYVYLPRNSVCPPYPYRYNLASFAYYSIKNGFNDAVTLSMKKQSDLIYRFNYRTM
ncbi:hypothetical protein SSX86_017225 [Deinandra increscens subsp. villosa]|uniref:Peptidase C1A papain C-terminal domain-containing protein n=1 Tax=Deinandra increscens subsp. villosa TaxID=3103831 RepID=A0AAP0CUN5_9ASTR